MDTISNLNDIPSFWVLLPIILLSGLVLVYLFRGGDPAVRLRALGMSNRAYGVCLLMAALLTGIMFRFLDPRVVPWGGGDEYFGRAINIAEFGVYGRGTAPSAMFPPGYSFLLVPFVLVLGRSPWAFFITNFLLLAGVSLLLRQVLISLGSEVRHANIAGAFFLLTPNRLMATLLPLSDGPFGLIWTAAFALLLLSNRYPGRRWLPFAAGCIAGFAAVVRSPGILYIIPLVAGILACRAERWPSRRLRAALLIGGAVLALTPWTVRNYLLWGKAVPVSNNGGFNLAVGNNPSQPVTWNPYCDTSAALRLSVADAGGVGWNEAQKDSFLAGLALRYMLSTPGGTLTRGLGKIVRTINSDAYSFGFLETYTNARRLIFPLRSEFPHNRTAANIGQAFYSVYYHALYLLNGVLYYLMLGLTFRFLLTEGRRRSPAAIVIIALAVCVAAVVFIFFGLSRYKEPLSAVMVLYVALRAYSAGRGGESGGGAERAGTVGRGRPGTAMSG